MFVSNAKLFRSDLVEIKEASKNFGSVFCICLIVFSVFFPWLMGFGTQFMDTNQCISRLKVGIVFDFNKEHANWTLKLFFLFLYFMKIQLAANVVNQCCL